MLRWLLFLIALALALLGSLTVVRSPPWSPWQYAVVAGEFGHQIAGVALIAALTAALGVRRTRGKQRALSLASLALCLLATGLLLKPALQARRIAATLGETIARSLGGGGAVSAGFSLTGLYFNQAGPRVAVRTLHTASRLPIDFYPAQAPAAKGSPCVMVIHGGGWEAGDRLQLPELNQRLSASGYAVAAISYRLAPKHRWPAQREDAAEAIAFLKSQAPELGIDPTRLVLLGRSAGGQIALVAAYVASDPAIRGVVALYAPSDLIFGYVNTHENDAIKSPALMRRFLGGTPDSARANYESASALNFVTKHSPPTLLLHGENDPLVWHRHSVRLDSRLKELGVPCVFVSLPWASHAFDYKLNGPGGQLLTLALEPFLAHVTQ